jgi:hypothetical protein
MSILDALRVQKANQQSVSQLAALPQNEIIRLAQVGHIPADVVPVIISEKARMAKEMANLQAAAQTQGRQMPTVIEQAMQANAQAEMPQQPPPQAPMQSPEQPPAQPQTAPQGVAGLPMGQMFQGQNFEAGGIVAFAEGGMSEIPPKELARAFANAARDKTTGKDVEVLMAGLGVDEGSLGFTVAKISDEQRQDLAKMLVAQYGTQLGNLTLSGQAAKVIGGPSGTYQLGAQASYPMGSGRLSAGLGALHTPQKTRITDANLGYETPVGQGRLMTGVNFPRGGAPQAQMRYQMPFETGGIVAFNGEEDSFVEGPTGLKQLRSEVEPPKPGAGPASLAEFIKQFQGMTAASRRPSAEEIAYQEALKKGALSPKDVEQQKYMRLLQAGLGIMGGTSPYGLANIGQGAQEALKGYGEDVRSQQAQRLAELKAAAESSRAQRAEGMQDIQGGAQLYGQYLDRELRRELAKDSQLGAKYAENYLAMKRSEGDRRPDDVIRNEGYNEFFKRYGFAEQRAAIAAGTAQAGQRVQLAGIEERYVNQAQDSVDKTLGSFASAESREYRKLQREDPTGKKAAEFRQKLVNDRARELQSAAQVISPGQTAAPQGGQAAAPSAPAKPDISKVPGAPRGATVGKLVEGKGWEVLASDGKLVGYLQP